MLFVLRCFLLFSLVFLTGCKEELYKNLTQNEVNQMLLILNQAGVNTKKVTNKKGNAYSISVDEFDLPKAIAVLKEQGYPRDSARDCKKGDGIVISPFEQRAFFICKLSQDIQITLTKIDGVFTARVHIVLPENDPFKTDFIPSSAAVFIKHHPNIKLKKLKSSIKLIVEKSIEGLSYDKVSVVMLPATTANTLLDPDSATPTNNYAYLYYLLVPIGVLLGLFFWRIFMTRKDEKLQTMLTNESASSTP